MTASYEHLRLTADEAVRMYAEAVAANRESSAAQAGPPPSGGDRWHGRAATFRGSLTGPPETEAILDLVRTGETWLDIGAGGGRYALPLAGKAGRVVAVEPSAAMREQLAEACREHGVTNIDIVPEAWPTSSPQVPRADGALMANVLYGASNIGPFLDAAEAMATRVCVILAFDRAPSTPMGSIWQAVHGSPHSEMPALRELLTVLIARGRHVNVRALPPEPAAPLSIDDCLRQFSWMYHVRPGTPEEERLRAAILAECSTGDGLVRPPVVRRYASLIWWDPGVR